MRNHTRSLPFVACAVLLCLMLASGWSARAALADSKLADQIEALLKEPGLKGGIQGVLVQSLVDGTTLYERNSDVLFMPASNQKLVTTAAALHLLGPGYQYDTSLYRSGLLTDGLLGGNLYLVGSGDPFLDTKDINDMVEALRVSGIRKITGKVIGVDGKFDREYLGLGWSWGYLSDYYAAPVGALNLNKNTLTVEVHPGRNPGDAARILVTPSERFARVINRARTTDKGQSSSLSISRELGQNVVIVDGAIAIDAKPEDIRPMSVTVENPARFTTAVLAERIRRVGIEIGGEDVESKLPENTIPVTQHLSKPLSELVAMVNKPSDNLAAECLLKTIAAEKSKSGVGTTSGGIKLVDEWFKSLGVAPEGVRMADGSGLSRMNYISPRTVGIVLKTMHSHPYAKLFLDSLPVAGVDGTLRNRMKNTVAQSNCRAKTGTIANVSSLSGYIKSKDGTPLLFVILMNNQLSPGSTAVDVQNKIAVLLAEHEKSK